MNKSLHLGQNIVTKIFVSNCDILFILKRCSRNTMIPFQFYHVHVPGGNVPNFLFNFSILRPTICIWIKILYLIYTSCIKVTLNLRYDKTKKKSFYHNFLCTFSSTHMVHIWVFDSYVFKKKPNRFKIHFKILCFSLVSHLRRLILLA